MTCTDDSPFLIEQPEATASAVPPAVTMLSESSPASPSEPEAVFVESPGVLASGDETGKAGGESAPAPKSAMKVKTKIEFDVTAEPYAPGQCTVILALAIRPDDGHPDGRLVVLGVRSHDEAPILATARLNTLKLPEPLVRLLAEYETQLSRRGEAKAEARAKEAAEKKAAEERRQASRKGAATAKSKHGAAAKTEPKPAAKPASTQVSLFGA